MTSLEDYLFTKNTKWVLIGTGGVLVAALIFHAGVVVGSHNSRHFQRGAEGDTPPGFLGGMMPREGFMQAGYGAVGVIKTISLPAITIQGRDGVVRQIYAGASTTITGGTSTKPSVLMPGQVIIVIGEPNDTDDQGFIDARVIRILPAPPTTIGTSTAH